MPGILGIRFMNDPAYTCLPRLHLLLLLCTLEVLVPELGWTARLDINASVSITSKQINELAHDPVWLKLLHYKDGQSEVLTKKFFLSSDGTYDPAAELLATLDAYSEPWSTKDNNDTHARCRFPARYFWLSSHVALPDYSPQPPQCTRLSKWSLPDQVTSTSIFLVSGYLGNPASVFGHTLLKFNTESQDDQAGLFDLTVNYGAVVPENESTLRYIIYGIGGGYQAGFSDRYFYTQDLVYSRKEFRDIWDYQLRLSDQQQQLLIFHLWEILGKKFTYYFFHKNCAARLAELLELILEEQLLDNARCWYAPVEIFHHLEEIDQVRPEAGKDRLIQSIRFIPSVERTLYYRFNQLNEEEKQAVQAVIEKGTGSLQESLELVDTKQQLAVLDTLLAYYTYRLVEDAPNPAKAMQQGKKDLLLARLGLPPRTTPLEQPPELASPAKGLPPLLTGIGIGYSQARNSYLRLHLAPFTQESVGRNSLGGDEVTVLDTVVGIGENGFFIDRFDLLRIRKLKTNQALRHEKNSWSWQLRTGMESVAEDGVAEQDFFFRFGAGRAQKFANSITAYALLEASAHTEQPYARLFPHIGVLTDFGWFKSWFYGGASLSYQDHLEAMYGIELQYDMPPHSALSLQGEKDRIAVELKWYW
ncbi:MAG: DUF4105 domain-containing protein [Candidatus Electrothrix sp. AW1]|nr:DUF4105 domain-containing protein [Candidatus Electrothrix sp. AX1]MCI5182646.1 DUF4105 domain-containing protein [Candidatus Electrothrix gigas]